MRVYLQISVKRIPIKKYKFNMNSKDFYSDGEVENDLLSIFSSKNSKLLIKNILSNNPSWPMRYHLSPLRKNILDWYDFKSEESLLEIGAGCGAITEVFCSKLRKVVAIELSKLRSEIISCRHKDKNNLTVIAGNISNIKINEKFDYVSLIGVLEYAGKYTHTQDPYFDFLLEAKSFLKINGILIIAIENKFGLKYWAGCREDHTGKFFDSIENYPENKDIQTFGKYELKEVLKRAGFHNLSFYYPTPDYKFPTEIFSDNYLPTIGHNITTSSFPFRDYSQDRKYIFSEKLAIDNIIVNRQFDFFSNSFLIFAKQK